MTQIVQVTFTPGETPAEPGSWSFDVNPVYVDWSDSETISYQLTVAGESSESWQFDVISLSQLVPQETDFVSVNCATEVTPYPQVGQLGISSFSGTAIDLSVTNQTETQVVLGIALTVAQEEYRQTSRDPQVVLRPKT